jgi:hypothetical protein
MGLILHWKFLQEVKEEEENWENRAFWKLSQGIVVGEFWARGPGNRKDSGARESERLFLVGWEVNIQFGKLDRIINNQERG